MIIVNFVTEREKILTERPEKEKGREKSNPQRIKKKLDAYHQKNQKKNQKNRFPGAIK